MTFSPKPFVGSLPAKRMMAASFHTSDNPNIYKTDFFAKHFAETAPQGSFFAYLFRRFGFPNQPSDSYKELASYLLTTPKDDMLCQITPYAGGNTDISFSFFIPSEICSAINAWERKDWDAHHKALHHHIAHIAPKPIWAADWVKTCVENNKLFPNEIPENRTANFEDCVGALLRQSYAITSTGFEKQIQWVVEQEKVFLETHPKPEHLVRKADVNTWADDDPLKSYARAAITTLESLKIPVWVRDVPITPWGRADENTLVFDGEDEDGDCQPIQAKAAQSAGVDAGTVINADPDTWRALHATLFALGKGDCSAGMKRALVVLEPFLTDTKT